MRCLSSCLDFSSQMANGQDTGDTLKLLCSMMLLVVVSVTAMQSILGLTHILYTGPQAVVVLWQSKKEGRLVDPLPMRKGIVGQNLGGWAIPNCQNL